MLLPEEHSAKRVDASRLDHSDGRAPALGLHIRVANDSVTSLLPDQTLLGKSSLQSLGPRCIYLRYPSLLKQALSSRTLLEMPCSCLLAGELASTSTCITCTKSLFQHLLLHDLNSMHSALRTILRPRLSRIPRRNPRKKDTVIKKIKHHG